jgi:hypothetical protein
MRNIILLNILLLNGFISSLRADPIVFVFEASPGQSTGFNGSTVTLQGPSDPLGVNSATDLLGFNFHTSIFGTISSGPGATGSLFSSPFVPSLAYTATALTRNGLVEIDTYSNDYEFTLGTTFIEGVITKINRVPVGNHEHPTSGTWTVLGASLVPDTPSTQLLMLISILVQIAIFSRFNRALPFRSRLGG